MTINATDLDELIDGAFTNGRMFERGDIQLYLEAEAVSWQTCGRADIAGVLRKFSLDLDEETHLTDTAWQPRDRPSV